MHITRIKDDESYTTRTPESLNEAVDTEEIHVWRMRQAVFWSAILQFGLIFTYVLTVNINIFHPITSIIDTFSTMMDLSLWLKLFMLFTLIYTLGEFSKKRFISGPTYHSTRFKYIQSLFTIQNMILLILYMVMGTTMFWLYSSVSGEAYQHISRKCKMPSSYNIQPLKLHKILDESDCFQEEKLFLLAGGVWLGIYFFLYEYFFCSNFLEYPLIQQHKFYRLKIALKEKFKTSVKQSMLPTAVFITLYLLYGRLLRKKVVDLYSFKNENPPIDSFQGLINIRLLFSLWLFASIFIIALQSIKLLLGVFLTEHYVFPLSDSLTPVQNTSNLTEVLKSKNPVLRQLGFLDLFFISTKCTSRRKEIFLLSFPGGHPHKWNCILEECMKEIKSFSEGLENVLIKLSGEKMSSNVQTTSTPNVSEATFHFHSHKPNIRQLGIQSPLNRIEELMPNHVASKGSQSAVEVAFNNIRTWLNGKIEQFLKKPYICYFFMEDIDSRLNYILCQSQSLLWSVQSLSFLVAASLTEDSYGIVQRNLAEILSEIVGLKQIIDKLFKQNFLSRRSFSNDPLELQMKYLLKTTIKRCLYEIANTFGPYMKELNLPTDIELQMNNFINFKEGF